MITAERVFHMLSHMLCLAVPISANPPDGARSAETWGYASLAPIRWIGVFCHHSCREAVLRGLTSASRQIFIRPSPSPLP